MGVIFLVVAGVAFGWLFTVALRKDHPRGVRLNMVAGVGGALLAGLLVGPWAGGHSLADGVYTVDMVVFSAIGSLSALFALSLFGIRHHQ